MTEQERLIRKLDNYIDPTQQWLDLTPNQRYMQGFLMALVIVGFGAVFVVAEVAFVLLAK